MRVAENHDTVPEIFVANGRNPASKDWDRQMFPKADLTCDANVPGGGALGGRHPSRGGPRAQQGPELQGLQSSAMSKQGSGADLQSLSSRARCWRDGQFWRP